MKSLIVAVATSSLLPLLGEAAPPDSWIKAVAQGSASASVIVMAYLGIGFLKGERRSRQAEREASETFFKSLHEEHLDARAESRRSIEANTEALKLNIVATTRNNDLLDNFQRQGPFHRP